MANLSITHIITAETLADQFNGMDADEIEAFATELHEWMDDDTANVLLVALRDAQTASVEP